MSAVSPGQLGHPISKELRSHPPPFGGRVYVCHGLPYVQQSFFSLFHNLIPSMNPLYPPSPSQIPHSSKASMQIPSERYGWESSTSKALILPLVPELRTVSLFKLARVGQDNAPANSRAMLGINGSSWIARCRRDALEVARIPEQVEQRTLRLLFRRFCWLLGSPLQPLFVFDNSSGTSKDTLGLSEPGISAAHQFEDFLQVFGFRWFLGRVRDADELAGTGVLLLQ
ncbi:hypothetical protein OF83DRAFT_1101432 [Amylostereum chailletii]|nr:hypothetical protein OF83DRAFT_1101432 [Amylostereum chailletii]